MKSVGIGRFWLNSNSLAFWLSMDPKDVVTQLKKKGTFDELRKRLLADFQAQVTDHHRTESLKKP